MKKIFIASLLAASALAASAQSQRNLVITDVDGNRHLFPTDQIEGVLFEPIAEYQTLGALLYTRYEEKDGVGFYTVDLGTSAPDAGGNPAQIGDFQVSLRLVAPKSESLNAPVLPAGYFRPGAGSTEFSFDVAKSAVWQRLSEGNDGIAPTMIVDGSVDVRVDNNGLYDLRLELVTLGGPLELRYEGKVPFGAGVSDFEDFSEDLNLNFDSMTGRFYGNWYYPFAADMLLDFSIAPQGKDAADQWHLFVDFCEPKPADPMAPKQTVADGTYTVETREEIIDAMYLPFRFNPGQKVDFMGTEYINRTRLELTKADGHRALALINGGSFTVSENGTKFDFDFTTDQGIAIRGSYNANDAKVNELKNFCNNAETEPKRPYSTLTEDHTLNWADDTCAFFFDDGNSILNDDHSVIFMVCEPNMEKGDYLMFTFLTPDGRIAPGTYDINRSLESGSVIPGMVDFGGAPLFSWYGDLDTTDADGYQDTLGPIESGTITISSPGSEFYIITFNLLDDAGNAITGTYNGWMLDLSADLESAPARKIRARK